MTDTNFKYHKPIIGLTGAPGAGKSSVAGHFKKLDCAVIDADKLAHQALNESETIAQITAWWGNELLNQNGQIDRNKLGEIVFSNKKELKKLEKLIHPKVARFRKTLRQKYLSDDHIVALIEDSPLLLESKLDKQVDIIIFIDAPRKVRWQRLRQKRGWSDEKIASRENSQLSLDIKKAAADYIIDNSADEETCYKEVEGVLSVINSSK